jgi:hypothetical protein
VGWTLGGSRWEAYAFDEVEAGRQLVLRSVADPGDGFGTVAHLFPAGDWRGRTARFSASLEGDAAGSQVVLWLRVDGRDGEQLALDNRPETPLGDRFDWRDVEIVRDVPADAATIAFGVALSGVGVVRMRNARFEVADGGPAPRGPRIRPAEA